MADFGFNTNIPLGATVPRTSLSDMVNMASGITNLQQAQQLQPVQLEAARLQLQQAQQMNPLLLRSQQAETQVAESTARPRITQSEQAAETARIARENLAALQPTNTTATTGGGLATLANATGATTGRPTAEQAAATVATVYRNVLGRDPDPNGMAYWTQQLTSGNQDSATMYADFIRGAQANKETGNFGLSLADAQKGYTGYSSADASNIADEWVRNVLGREVLMLTVKPNGTRMQSTKT